MTAIILLMAKMEFGQIPDLGWELLGIERLVVQTAAQQGHPAWTNDRLY